MDSISLVKQVILIRDAGYPVAKGLVGDAAKTLAAYRLLTGRQIADALGVSHTAVQRHVDTSKDDCVPGKVNWDDTTAVWAYLENQTPQMADTLVASGTRRSILEHLVKNVQHQKV